MKRSALALAALVCLPACYNATVTTGRPASGQTVSVPWAHGFLFGLVPPAVVDVSTRCPNGVAQVSTQQSFLNMLANGLTLGLYTPMTITVACASAGSADAGRVIVVPRGGGRMEIEAALGEAVRVSDETHAPVTVDFSGQR
jgi:hypothetical protein